MEVQPKETPLPVEELHAAMVRRRKRGGYVMVSRELMEAALGLSGGTLMAIEYDIYCDAYRVAIRGANEEALLLGKHVLVPVIVQGQELNLLDVK